MGAMAVDRAREEIGDLYPGLPGHDPVQGSLYGDSYSTGDRVPVAYLWTRTVPCPNPAERPHLVPLVRQTWLAKRPGRCAALKVVPNRHDMSLRYEFVQATSAGGLGFDPEAFSRSGSTTCPLCGAPVSIEYVREQAMAGELGVELMSAGLLPLHGRGKTYVGSDEARALAPSDRIRHALDSLIDQGITPPAERITPRGLGIRVPRTDWSRSPTCSLNANSCYSHPLVSSRGKRTLECWTTAWNMNVPRRSPRTLE